MGSEKGGAKVIGGGGGAGGIFNLFDWKRKSRKKLFSNSPEGAKLVRRSEETLPSGRLQLVDDDEGIGVTSFKGSSDYSCASSVTDEEGREMKAPGVVARLMGLDALPTSGVPEPYCTPFRDTRSFRDSQSLKRSPEYSMNDQFSHVPRRVDGYMRKPLDLRAQKMPSSPIERFQIEALPPRSAKPLPMSHHRLLSPIKNPGFSSARNAAQIMEEAAKILQPRAQSSSREKICSFSPARIPLRVSDPRESISASQRTVSQRAQSSRNTPELPDVRFSRGQQMNRSWNSEEDIVIFRPSIDSYEINNPSCSKNNKGKSIYFEGLSIGSKNMVGDDNEDGSAYEDSTDFNDSFDEIDDEGHLNKRESRYPRFSENHEVPQFSLGMKFTDKKQFKEAIIKYGLHERKLIRFKKDDLQRVRAVCDWVTCPWTCLLSDTTKSESWQITTFIDMHRCPQRKDNKLVTAKRIAMKYEKLIRANPCWRIDSLKSHIAEETFADVSIHKVKRAKKLVMLKWLDATKGQYGKIYEYQAELLRSNPGSTVVVKLEPNTEVPTFQRIYVCLDAIKKGFMDGCRRVIGLDGCFFKGATNGELLCALGRDVNNQMYPIAWAVVEKENNESWD